MLSVFLAFLLIVAVVNILKLVDIVVPILIGCMIIFAIIVFIWLCGWGSD